MLDAELMCDQLELEEIFAKDLADKVIMIEAYKIYVAANKNQIAKLN